MTEGPLTEGDQGGIESYESGSGLAYSSLGGKRRTRGKRNSRKRSQRKSKRYMKKMYRGGNDDTKDTTEDTTEKDQLTQNHNQEPEQDGGRRRRKGKMNKGKTRKGKVSKWITHVKNFSRANKMDFRDALKDPKCKASYHKMK